MKKQPPAAIYARISRDERDEREGVQRQEADCRDLAKRLGYSIAEVFVDNDTGASSKSTKARPRYNAMIAAARAGTVSAILAYSTSRLTRRPREFEDLVELVERHRVQIRTVVSGDVNLATADGRLIARNLAAFDAAEAERTGERVARAVLERARQGKPHGATAYGWTRDDGIETLDPDAAPVVREAAERILAGETLRSIAADFRARGLPTPRRGEWNGTVLRQLLERERNAGRRIYRGEVIGRGEWPAILTDDEQDRLTALFQDPERRKARGTEQRYMMSGILRCGLCGATCRSLVGPKYRKRDGTESRRPWAYSCSKCYKLRRKVTDVDAVVEAVVLARLTREDGPTILAGDAEAARQAQAQRAALEARLDLAADEYADGKITAQQLARITARLQPQIRDAKQRSADLMPSQALQAFAVAPSDAWEGANAETRRQVVDALLTATLLPVGSGGRFDPEQVRIEWKA